MKHLLIIIFISLTHFSFGQKVIYDILGNAPTDTAFISFKKKLHSFARNDLKVLIEPTDTIVVAVPSALETYYDTTTNKKFQLKYVLTFGSPPTFKEYLDLNYSAGYSFALYGNKYVIIRMYLHTGSHNQADYYYEFIAEG